VAPILFPCIFHIQPECAQYLGTFRRILSVPHNIVMDLNNVMHNKNSIKWYIHLALHIYGKGSTTLPKHDMPKSHTLLPYTYFPKQIIQVNLLDLNLAWWVTLCLWMWHLEPHLDFECWWLYPYPQSVSRSIHTNWQRPIAPSTANDVIHFTRPTLPRIQKVTCNQIYIYIYIYMSIWYWKEWSGFNIK
jgi:hypothetical protein